MRVDCSAAVMTCTQGVCVTCGSAAAELPNDRAPQIDRMRVVLPAGSTRRAGAAMGRSRPLLTGAFSPAIRVAFLSCDAGSGVATRTTLEWRL